MSRRFKPGLSAIAMGLMIGAVSARAADCPSEVDQTLLQLDYDAFDMSDWRGLLMRECVDAAVAVLETYREQNARRLTAEQTRELHFHVGQALAFAGRETESVPHFERARGGDAEWSAYVDATLAFLKREKAALVAARERYARAPNANAMRLAVIDGFIRCEAESYAAAVHCGMPH